MPKGIPNKPAEQITKMDAMRKAVAELGFDATTKAYQRLIKSQFGHDMNANNISSYKSSVKKETARKSALIPTPAVEPAPVATPTASAAGFSLDEISAVKELADKIGTAKVKQLVEVLG